MSDEQTAAGAPATHVPGPSPAEPPAPPTQSSEQTGAATPSPKRKTALLIGIAVALLALCCCSSAGVGAFMYLRAGTSGKASSDTGGQTTQTPADSRTEEWLAWEPPAGNALDPMPESAHDVVFESLDIAAPGFLMDDAVWLPGYYDEAEDWYYSDAYFVRATNPASDKISAAVELWIQSDQMIDADVSFDPDPDTDVVDTIAGGSRELLYRRQWGSAGFDLATGDDTALWTQLGDDWPGAVIIEGRGDNAGEFDVTLTKWPLYAVDSEYPNVVATYGKVDDAWTLLNWEYVDVSGDSTDSPQSPAPPSASI